MQAKQFNYSLHGLLHPNVGYHCCYKVVFALICMDTYSKYRDTEIGQTPKHDRFNNLCETVQTLN